MARANVAAAQGRRLLLAIQFLTRIPTPQIRNFDEHDLTRSAGYFPLVGLVVGVALWLPLDLLHARPLLAGLVAFFVWVTITGALHLDGLGDVADAFGAAHRSPERFLEVLKDPHLGVFGVVTIGMQLLAKFVLLVELAPHHSALPPLLSSLAIVLIPAWARWGTMVWSRLVPPLQPGLAERFAWQLGWMSIGGWAVVLVAASLWLSPWLLLALPMTAIVVRYWRRKLGGISGDCLGASIEVTETVLLAVLAVALGASR